MHTWIIPAGAVTAEGFLALEKEFFVLYNNLDNTYTLRKQLPGPILITNYDPDTLPVEERMQLSKDAGDWMSSDIAFDIRSGIMEERGLSKAFSGSEASMPSLVFSADLSAMSRSMMSGRTQELPQSIIMKIPPPRWNSL